MALRTINLDAKHIAAIHQLMGGSTTDYMAKMMEQFDLMRSMVGTTIAHVVHESKGKLDDTDKEVVTDLLKLYYRTTALHVFLKHLHDDPKITADFDPAEEHIAKILSDVSEFTVALDTAETEFKAKAQAAADVLKAKKDHKDE